MEINWWYWLRAVGMVISLSAVLWVKHYMSEKHTPTATGSTEAPTIALCPTRITWIETPDGTHIEEQNTHWMKSVNKGPMEELEPVATEKWTSEFCQSPQTRVASEASNGPWKDELKIGYIKGPERTLKTNGKEWQIDGIPFTAENLSETLRKINELPAAKNPKEN